MSDPIAHWHAEHVNFASLLDILEKQLDLFHRGKPPDYGMMLDIMFYMTHYPDVLHHPKEDLAFALIKQREPSAGPVIDRLTEQHDHLKRWGDALVIALDDIVNGSITSREHVEAPGRTYLAEFRSHMETEEAEILPLAQKLLRQEDWAAIGASSRSVDDPLLSKTGGERYAELRRQIAREARASKASPR
jgi:hemerythrin-like domain-containing protein